MKRAATLNLSLHKAQGLCFTSEATEILYGGAAGGGKSHCFRVISIFYALAVPNIQIYLFRRKSDDLKLNHLDGASGYRVLLAPYIQSGFARINETTGQISFNNGAKIHLCHCQHEKNKYDYQGVEIHLLLIDELTHFTEEIYNFLRSRVRLGGLNYPKGLNLGGQDVKLNLPKIICGSNPGWIGHDFVKKMFIDNAKPFELRQMKPEDGGMIRQYIPAKLSDNPTMMESDPFYAQRLLGLGGALAKAMLDGDWDAIEGAYFNKFDQATHVIEGFEIPSHWFKIRAFDWGYSKPFCVLWGAVSDGSLVIVEGQRRVFPRNSIIIYREFYGWTGKADEGAKMEATEIAKQIRKIQPEKVDCMVADPAIFDVSRGESIADQMSKPVVLDEGTLAQGIFWQPADNKRINGWQQIRNRLVGVDSQPLLYIFKSCRNLIRTLPIMQFDLRRPEDLDTAMEDHAVDTLRYMCMSRPIVVEGAPSEITIAERNRLAFRGSEIKKQLMSVKKSFE